MSELLRDQQVNQTPPYVDIDLFTTDQPLRDALTANGGAAAAAALSAFGRAWGSAAMAEQARRANENAPQLKGDRVVFDPAYHHFMAQSMQAGLHMSTWTQAGVRAPAPAEVARAARFYMVAQVENGHMCPITMTRAAVAALGAAPELLAQLMPKIAATAYDPCFLPWQEKSAITLGMGMTELQGGTDVRANTTKAVPTADGYAITGHKWFMSAPMSDAFLVLAQAPGGLTCFFMPRFRPDGEVNDLDFQRLKDKLGNRSNASSEVAFENAFALRVGEEGRGIQTILQMVQLTRLDCAISSAGIMRMALAQAIHHARHRIVFQKKLIDQPVMGAVLADMALDCEAAVAAVMRLCRSLDRAQDDSFEAARARLLTPVVKYWICKTAPAFVYEAMECLGGNGYVEDSIMPRLYREAPVNAIWEGSGNVMALDMLRAFQRDERAYDVVSQLQKEVARVWPEASAATAWFIRKGKLSVPETAARAAIEQLALLAATEALSHSAADIAPVFARARLSQPPGRLYGAARIDDAPLLLRRALAFS